MHIIGVDCATDQSKIGLTFAAVVHGTLRIHEVRLASAMNPADQIVARWLKECKSDVLIALDAPLGWPIEMGSQLARHRAGEVIITEPNQFFRRETDRFIQSRMNKTPLDVGADRIARTAHAALKILRQLRNALELPLPLAWEPGFTGVAAIEVYPAATLLAHGLSTRNYKKPNERSGRSGLLQSLQNEVLFDCPTEIVQENADALDAVACVLAGHDFLRGFAQAPEDLALAQREGWIWVAPLGFTSARATGQTR